MAEFSQARIVNENRVFMCWSGREKQEQTKQKKNNRVPQARKLLTRMSWKYLWGSKSELYQQGFNSCYILFWPDKALVWKQYVFFNIVIFSRGRKQPFSWVTWKKNCISHSFGQKERGPGLCTLADTVLLSSKEIHGRTGMPCFYLRRTPDFLSKHPLKSEAAAGPPYKSDPNLWYSQNPTQLLCSALAAPGVSWRGHLPLQTCKTG